MGGPSMETSNDELTPHPPRSPSVLARSLPATAARHAGGLCLLAFRHLRAEAQEDAIAEVVASTLVAFVGLVERGKMSSAYATVAGSTTACWPKSFGTSGW